jgi:hypothetical protein
VQSLRPRPFASRGKLGQAITWTCCWRTGTDVNIRDNDGRTPLNYARDRKLDYMAERLKQRGARSGKD